MLALLRLDSFFINHFSQPKGYVSYVGDSGESDLLYTQLNIFLKLKIPLIY